MIFHSSYIWKTPYSLTNVDVIKLSNVPSALVLLHDLIITITSMPSKAVNDI